MQTYEQAKFLAIAQMNGMGATDEEREAYLEKLRAKYALDITKDKK